MRNWQEAAVVWMLLGAMTAAGCGTDEGLESGAGGLPTTGGSVTDPDGSAEAGADGLGSGGQPAAAAGSATASPDGGRPPVAPDADGGSGPKTGSAGDSSTSEPTHGNAGLGSPCAASTACLPGLTCLAAGDSQLGDRSIPHGSCTRPCLDSEECVGYDPGALCVPLTPDSEQGYCVEGCAFGEPLGSAVKCHGRPDFACLPALLAPLGAPCSSSADCAPGDLCTGSGCALVLPACLPSCRGDLDCPSDRYCDQAFLSGTCTTAAPTGKDLGEPCTVPGAGQPLEPDECLGFCQSDEGGPSGHCAASCGLSSGCAWNNTDQRFDGACLYLSALTVDVAGVGDFGFCTPTCSCSDACQADTLECVTLPDGRLDTDAFSGPGLCFAKEVGSTPIDQCRP